MNKLVLIGFTLGLVLVGIGIVLAKKQPTNQSPVLSQAKDQATSPNETSPTAYLPQEYQFGQAGVTLTPQQLTPGQEIIFSAAFETRSVDLAYDLQQIVVLKDETGREYQLLEWTGGSGGHHWQGELVFEPLSAETKSLTLTLSGIENQSQEFTWGTDF